MFVARMSSSGGAGGALSRVQARCPGTGPEASGHPGSIGDLIQRMAKKNLHEHGDS